MCRVRTMTSSCLWSPPADRLLVSEQPHVTPDEKTGREVAVAGVPHGWVSEAQARFLMCADSPSQQLLQNVSAHRLQVSSLLHVGNVQ